MFSKEKKQIKVCLIGTDGSGKTTLSSNVNSRLNSSKIIWCGAESYLMKPIRYVLSSLSGVKRFSTTEKVSNEAFQDSVRRRSDFVKRVSFLEWIYIFFVMIDYRFQYLIRMARNKNPDYLIMDRYIFDVALNLAVVLSWSDEKMINFLRSRLTNYYVPDCCFYVKVPPEISFSRKKDIPNIEYIKTRTHLYDLIAKEFDFTVLDGCDDIIKNSTLMTQMITDAYSAQKITYIHSNNYDVGGADYCLARMCGSINKTKKFRAYTLLRLPTKILTKYRDEGSFALLGKYARPQFSKGVLGLILFPIYAVTSAVFFYRFLKCQKPDWVHVNDLYDFIPALIAKFLNIKVAYHIRMIRESKFEKRLFSLLISFVATSSMSVSNSVKNNYFRNEYGPFKCEHTVIRDWTDDSLYQLKTMYPKPKCFEDFSKVIVMVGRLEMWKGQHVFLDALKLIESSELENVGVFIIGGDVVGSSKERYAEEVKKSAAELGVHMLGERSDVPALLSNANISIHASVTPDPFPGVVVESLMTGVYCIGANGGGVPEMIENGFSGALFSVGNPSDLADKIKWALNHPSESREIAKKGSETIRKLTSKSIILDNLTKLYHK